MFTTAPEAPADLLYFLVFVLTQLVDTQPPKNQYNAEVTTDPLGSEPFKLAA